MNKTMLWVLVAVVVAGISFYAGDAYGKSATASKGQFVFANGSGQYGGMGMGGRGMRNGGVTAGEVLSSDQSSVTIKLPTGSTQIILVGTSTQVFKSSLGSLGDLTPGTAIVVNGTPNSDGSLTAQAVQIRPAGSTFSRPQGQ